MKTHFEEEFEREYDTVTELVTSAVLSGVIDRGIKDDFIMYIERVRKNGRYFEPSALKITDGEIEFPLTLKSLKGYLGQWKKESEHNKEKLGITKPLQFESHSPKDKTKVFTDYLLIAEKVKLMILLKNVLVGAKAKDIVRFIIALRELHYIDIPTPQNKLWKAIRVEFKVIFSDSAMNGHFAPTSTQIASTEIEETKQLIKNHLNI